jgi:hypothetical protein
MPSFLVETYLGRTQIGERLERERRAGLAANTATSELRRVRFERSIHIPEDEICFFLFDAPSAKEAAVVAESAGLDALRVLETNSSRTEHP